MNRQIYLIKQLQLTLVKGLIKDKIKLALATFKGK